MNKYAFRYLDKKDLIVVEAETMTEAIVILAWHNIDPPDMKALLDPGDPTPITHARPAQHTGAPR